MHKFSTLSLTEIAALIREGATSPTAATQSYLERIDNDELDNGSYLLVTPEFAHDHARQAEEEMTRGLYRGPLHGMPIALKDLYEVYGQRTTAGSAALRNHVSTLTSTAVAKLQAAGTVILGKLNMHEWALGVIGDNPHYGVCRNPWDGERICGGSSSGSGAAVAAGLCAGALGSDTRGSVRIPAALCGIVGLKPTYGRVSLHGVIPLSWSLDHAGPMARRVEDVAHLLTAMAGYDPLDPYSVDRPVDDYHGALKDGVRGWRIAYDAGSYSSDPAVTEPHVLAAYHQAVHTFKQLGAEVHGVDISFLSSAMLLSRQVVASDAAAFHEVRLQTAPDLFGEDVLFRLRNDPPPTPMAYAHARHEGALLSRRLAQFFDDYEVLLLPTIPMTAVRRDDKAAMDKGRTHYSRFTSPFNLAGVPALSLPCGFSGEGLPIGLQIVGGHWREAAVLRAAYAYEAATNWHTRRPGLA